MITAFVTLMMCTSPTGALVPFEVPGTPVIVRGFYSFPDLGIRFSRKTCYVENLNQEDADVVQ
jgi:hypothetical protein